MQKQDINSKWILFFLIKKEGREKKGKIDMQSLLRSNTKRVDQFRLNIIC